ncbi:MAG: hypothetical protein ABFC89_11335 [Methanospirillum sp.]
MHARTAELRARMIYGWARAAGGEQLRRAACVEAQGGDPVEIALIGLESDLSYLEELPADRVEAAGAVLDELDERLKRVIASLENPSA